MVKEIIKEIERLIEKSVQLKEERRETVEKLINKLKEDVGDKKEHTKEDVVGVFSKTFKEEEARYQKEKQALSTRSLSLLAELRLTNPQLVKTMESLCSILYQLGI